MIADASNSQNAGQKSQYRPGSGTTLSRQPRNCLARPSGIRRKIARPISAAVKNSANATKGRRMIPRAVTVPAVYCESKPDPNLRTEL